MSLRWLVRRVAGMLLVVLGVIVLVFFMLRLIPGDPAVTVLGIRATPAAIAVLHEEWGLDEPLPAQFGRFLARTVQGDLGDSLVYHEPVATTIGGRLEPSAWLLVMGALFAAALSIPLAIIAAARKDKPVDHLIRVIPLVGFAMPAVWVGLMMILVFSLTLGLFPVGGFEAGFAGHVRSMVLPSVTMALLLAPLLIRSLRTSLLDTLESDYVLTARSKGIPERRVFVRHALRNAAVPSITVFGFNIIVLIGNLVVIEKVYALPGVGSLLVDGVLARDFPVVQGVTLLLAVVVLVVYLLTDVALAKLDPRVTL